MNSIDYLRIERQKEIAAMIRVQRMLKSQKTKKYDRNNGSFEEEFSKEQKKLDENDEAKELKDVNSEISEELKPSLTSIEISHHSTSDYLNLMKIKFKRPPSPTDVINAYNRSK